MVHRYLSSFLVFILGALISVNLWAQRFPGQPQLDPELEKIEERASEEGMTIVGVGKSAVSGLDPEFGLPAIDVPTFNGIRRAVETANGTPIVTSTDARAILQILVVGNHLIREAFLQVKNTLLTRGEDSYEKERLKALELIDAICKGADPKDVGGGPPTAEELPSSGGTPAGGNCLLKSEFSPEYEAMRAVDNTLQYKGFLDDTEMILTYGVLVQLSNSLDAAEAKVRSALRRLYLTKIEAALEAVDEDHFLPVERRDFERERLVKFALTLEKQRIQEVLRLEADRRLRAKTLREANEKLYSQLIKAVEVEKKVKCGHLGNPVWNLFGLIGNSRKRCEGKIKDLYKNQLQTLDPKRV